MGIAGPGKTAKVRQDGTRSSDCEDIRMMRKDELKIRKFADPEIRIRRTGTVTNRERAVSSAKNRGRTVSFQKIEVGQWAVRFQKTGVQGSS